MGDTCECPLMSKWGKIFTVEGVPIVCKDISCYCLGGQDFVELTCCALERQGKHEHYKGKFWKVVTDRQVILVVPAKKLASVFSMGSHGILWLIKGSGAGMVWTGFILHIGRWSHLYHCLCLASLLCCVLCLALSYTHVILVGVF